MTFKRVQITDEVRALFRFGGPRVWLSDPIVLDDASDARLYQVREAAGNDTIDNMYFEEGGESTLIYMGKKVWYWSPQDRMNSIEVARRHRRILDAIVSIDHTISLRAYPRPKDIVRRNRIFMGVAIVGYLILIMAMLHLIPW